MLSKIEENLVSIASIIVYAALIYVMFHGYISPPQPWWHP